MTIYYWIHFFLLLFSLPLLMSWLSGGFIEEDPIDEPLLGNRGIDGWEKNAICLDRLLTEIIESNIPVTRQIELLESISRDIDVCVKEQLTVDLEHLIVLLTARRPIVQ